MKKILKILSVTAVSCMLLITFVNAQDTFKVTVSARKISDNPTITKTIEDDGWNYKSEAVITLYDESATKIDSFCESNNGGAVITAVFNVPDGKYFYNIKKNGYVTYTSDVFDVTNHYTAPEINLIPGDIKGSFDDSCGDGIVDLADFIRLIRFFDTNTSSKSAVVDINEDGCVNVDDLVLLKTNFGATESAGY